MAPSPARTRDEQPIYFGPFEVTSQVFLRTPHSFALVNLKPLLPGHVLVCPARRHRRLTDLAAPELTDLFLAVQRVQRMLARHYFRPVSDGGFNGSSGGAHGTATTPEQPPPPEAGAFNMAIQDGAGAGQTVPHVHVHVIPRIRGSTAREQSDGPGDELYEDMAAEAGNVGGALWDLEAAAARNEKVPGARPVAGGAFPRIEEAERAARSMEQMEAEAEVFRGVLKEMEREEKGAVGGS